MSELNQDGQPQPVVESVAAGGASAGALLKAAREAQGLHVDILAVMLKVPVAKLEALEADRYDALTDVVFTRALAASMCRALKIDPTGVMAALPKTEIRRVTSSLAGLNTPIKTSRFSLGEQLTSRFLSPLGIAGALLVLAILAVVLWPDVESLDVVSVSQDAVVRSEIEPVEASTSAMPGLTPAISLPAETSVPLPLAPQQATPVQEAPAAPGAAPAHVPASLVLQARGACWVQVTDANGVVQARKIMEAGEVAQFDGALPLAVVLGRADQVDVSVRGQRLDVTAMIQGNVARFEVK